MDTRRETLIGIERPEDKMVQMEAQEAREVAEASPVEASGKN